MERKERETALQFYQFLMNILVSEKHGERYSIYMVLNLQPAGTNPTPSSNKLALQD